MLFFPTNRLQPSGTYGPRSHGYSFRYFPKSAVVYPPPCNHVARVFDSSRFSPWWLSCTPVLWAYSPVRIDAREGQHRGVLRKASGNHSQCPSASSKIWDWSQGIAGGSVGNVSSDWSSVTITITLGRARDALGDDGAGMNEASAKVANATMIAADARARVAGACTGRSVPQGRRRPHRSSHPPSRPARAATRPAAIESAISSGDVAPRSIPTGDRTRARSSCENPIARSAST